MLLKLQFTELERLGKEGGYGGIMDMPGKWK